MYRFRKLITLAVAGPILALVTSRVDADVVISVTQVGNSVVFEGSGELDLSAMIVSENTIASGPIVNPTLGSGVLRVGAFGNTPIDNYGAGGLTAPVNTPFGSTFLNFIDAGSGDMFGVSYQDALGAGPAGVGPRIVVPDGYTSGPLQGNLLFENETIASLDLIPGTYVWAWGSGGNADSLTLSIVPEPSSASVLAFCGLIVSLRRRRAG